MLNKIGKSEEIRRLEALIKHHRKAAERARDESNKAITKLDAHAASVWVESAKNSDRIVREAQQKLDALNNRKSANGYLIKDGGRIYLK